MTALSVAPSLLTLADIAELAHVQRPVVSVWRSRSAGTAHPFPAAAERLDGREAFRLDDVVSWLEQTGRGNNPAARQDAAASTALDLLPVADRSIAVEGLLALLALKAQLGTSLAGLSADDLADLADDVDPHDRCLFREITVLGGDVTIWAQHADALASAAYTPGAAVTSLLGRHHRLGLATVSAQTFAPVVLALAGRLAVELSAGGSRDFVVPDGDADLLLSITASDDEPGSVSVPVSDEPAARRARRVLLAGGWDVTDAVKDDGLVVPAPGSIVLVRMPSATRPGMSDAEVVDALGAIEATLPADGRAVALGPARALCGRLPGALQSARATVLRSGRVHAIVRLPARLWPAHPRQELGLWILGPRRPKVAAGEHRTALADLRATSLDDAAVDDLVIDLVAAVEPSMKPGAHAFRFVRFVTTTVVIATSGDLVTTQAPGRRSRELPAEVALDLAQAFARASEPVPVPVPRQVRAGEQAGPKTVTLGRLVELGHLRLVQGTRFHDSDLAAGGGVRVHSTSTLTDTVPGRVLTIDRLLLAGSYLRSRYTEPGDVVFCTTPRPAAVVDREGLAVMAAPVRALRRSATAPAGLLAEVVAQAISIAPGVGGWRLWQVPIVPTGQVDAVRTALAELAEARAATAERVAGLDTLAHRLVDAVTRGSVALVDPDTSTQMEG